MCQVPGAGTCETGVEHGTRNQEAGTRHQRL